MQIDFEALNFDATDADTLQKYLGAMDAIAEKANKFDKKAPQPKQYRYLCKTVKACFDDIFGAGMGEKICEMPQENMNMSWLRPERTRISLLFLLAPSSSLFRPISCSVRILSLNPSSKRLIRC